MAESTKVLVIDDHPLFRDALELALIKSKVVPQNIQSVSNLPAAIEYVIFLLMPESQSMALILRMEPA